MAEPSASGTEIINFSGAGRPDCAICADPADRHGVYEIVTSSYKGFRFQCATVLKDGSVCDCQGYEPMMEGGDDA